MNKDNICNICNSIIYDDDTASNCLGECGRASVSEDSTEELNFDEQVVTELPDPSEYWHEMSIDDDYYEEDDMHE